MEIDKYEDDIQLRNGDTVGEQSKQLKEDIRLLQLELDRIESMTDVFGTKIRTLFANEIVEEQELSILYREMQREKRDKRRAIRNKQRGIKSVDTCLSSPKDTAESSSEASVPSVKRSSDGKEVKRLYREAMLKVHPDRFAHEEELEDKAAEVTRQLIEIYQSNDLHKLKDYHAYIMSGHAILDNKLHGCNKSEHGSVKGLSYLKKTKQTLEDELNKMKSEQLYIVLTTYSDPMTFMDEIRLYFDDRLMKLRKRTRKARKVK